MSKILENKKNTKQLYKIVNKVTNSNWQNSKELAEEITDYSLNKIKQYTEQYTPRPSNQPLFRRFAALAKDEVKKEIFNMITKTYNLEPIPTNLLKQFMQIC